MAKTTGGLWRWIIRCFAAGVLTVLPVVATLAIIAWVAGIVHQYVGPRTAVGAMLRNLGLGFASNDTLAYCLGVAIVLAIIFGIGVAVESGARNLIQRLTDAVLQRIPLVGSVYGTTKQVVGLLDNKDDAAMKGMKPVFCGFGREAGAGFLALLVSPQSYLLGGRDYQVVIVPTSPVPIGGGLLFVPTEVVQPLDLSVEGLMSIYVSMGITTGQFLEASNSEPGLSQPSKE
jgi:uncharacterized membrane protein